MNMYRFAFSTLAVVALAQAALAHSDDLEVGFNPATNQIVVEYDLDLYPWLLPPSEEPALAGFALDDPGFVSIVEVEEPGEFEPLSALANIQLRVLSASPAFKVWDPLGPGEAGFQIEGPRLWTIGPRFFDTHPWWQIDTSDPAYDPAAGPWSVTFELIDAAGIHQPSDPITLTFIPEPGGLTLLAAAALVLRRRV